MPSVGQRHRHQWLRVQGQAGAFICHCGARGVMTDAGFCEQRPLRRRAKADRKAAPR
jgi:hypothetical protein